MNDVELTNSEIILYTHNAAEKNMLKTHLTTLKNLAGAEVTLKLQDKAEITIDDHPEYITRLKDLFGDKVEIV
jgi:hypothetical protein